MCYLGVPKLSISSRVQHEKKVLNWKHSVPAVINCPKSRQPRDSSLMGTSTAQDMSLAQTPQSTWDESLDCIRRDSTGISPEAGDDSGLLDMSLRLRSSIRR